jgi:hypothetical protein
MNIGMRFITSGDIGGLTSYEKQININTEGVNKIVKIAEREFGGNSSAIEVAGIVSDGDHLISTDMLEVANDNRINELAKAHTLADAEGMGGLGAEGLGGMGAEGLGGMGAEGMGSGMIGGGIHSSPNPPVNLSGAGQFDSRFIPQPFRGAPPVITVDTSSEAMASDGLLGQSNGGRMRRYGSGGGGMGGMGGGMGGGGGMSGGGYIPGRVEGSGQDAIVLKPSAPIFVNKLG